MKEEFSIISVEMAELIVEICFITNDLKHAWSTQTGTDLFYEMRCDRQIIYHMDAVLAADGLNEFRTTLDTLINVTGSFAQIYSTSNWSFPEKENLQNTLRKLSVCLKQLQQHLLIPHV